MELTEVKEIIDCLPKGRTPFYYFKDRYALLLLGMAIDAPVRKRDLKGSAFARLLDKDVVKSAISKCGSAAIVPDTFDIDWPSEYECYLLTLGAWASLDRWGQTSRRGYNLVLQLNFSSRHDKKYRKLIETDGRHPFEFRGHPVSTGKLRTLAWSRMDIDLSSGEALIEEIQNDWIRCARRVRRRAGTARNVLRYRGVELRASAVVEYVDSVLQSHASFWDEAMLSATIWFLRRELGIRTIYYHTHESGAALKRIKHTLPPRSIYSALPRRFCFAKTDARPGFLPLTAKFAAKRKALNEARFQVLRW